MQSSITPKSETAKGAKDAKAGIGKPRTFATDYADDTDWEQELDSPACSAFISG